MIAKSFHLTNKSDYRRKFGVTDQDVYVCYPKHGLGFRGIEAIVASVRDPEKGRKKELNGSASSSASQNSSSMLRELGLTKTGLKDAPSDVAPSSVDAAFPSSKKAPASVTAASTMSSTTVSSSETIQN